MPLWGKFRRLPKGSRRRTVKSRQLFVGILTSRDSYFTECVMRLNDNLIDCSELEVFNQESHLLLHARELLPESEVDCPCGFEDYPDNNADLAL